MEYKSGQLVRYKDEIVEVLEVKKDRLIIEIPTKKGKSEFKEIKKTDIEDTEIDIRNKKLIIKRR